LGDPEATSRSLAATQALSAPPDEPPVARCSTDAELHVVTLARRAVASGQARQALALLDRQHQQCPTGEWSPTSWRLRIELLCVLDRTAEAKVLMDWYWAEHTREARLAQAHLADSCPAFVLHPSLGAGALE
jgi:hypothetical protein